MFFRSVGSDLLTSQVLYGLAEPVFSTADCLCFHKKPLFGNSPRANSMDCDGIRLLIRLPFTFMVIMVIIIIYGYGSVFCIKKKGSSKSSLVLLYLFDV